MISRIGVFFWLESNGRVVNTWVLVLHGLWVTAGLIFLAASLLGPEDVTDDVSSRWTYNGSCIELSCYSLTPLLGVLALRGPPVACRY